MIALAAASPGDGAVTIIYVLIGVVTLLGAGGLLGVYKWAKRQGVRDAQLDLVIGVVLGDGNGGKPLRERLDAQDRKLDQIQHEATPNGGNTSRLGDTTKRIERKVDASDRKLDEMNSKLDQHIGQSTEVHDGLRRRMTAIERRSA
jgi:tetrahydromethanopterin S-methyltransferase subunit G